MLLANLLLFRGCSINTACYIFAPQLSLHSSGSVTNLLTIFAKSFLFIINNYLIVNINLIIRCYNEEDMYL